MNNLENSTYILIDKFHSGQASAEEVAMLHEWKNTSQDNKKVYLELILLLDLIRNLKEWKQFDYSTAWPVVSQRMARKPLRLTWFISAAAAILIFVLFATVAINKSGWRSDEVEYLTGSQDYFSILEDGSELFLSENSVINLEGFSKQHRTLKTEGNYFVHVAHDQDHPFTIQTDKISIKVLGTSFKVEEDDLSTNVKVRDGKVLITNTDGSQYTLRSNESFTLKNGNVNIGKLTEENWGLYDKNFQDEPIYKVLEQLSDKFGHLQINEAVKNAQCRITTKIGQSTIIEILEEIDLIFNVDYTIKDGSIIVNKISC